MKHKLRAVSWNCNRATAEKAELWKYLMELNPDTAFLQEVNSIPANICSVYRCYKKPAVYKDGSQQRFSTVLLVKGQLGDPIHLMGGEEWLDNELEHLEGNLLGSQLLPEAAQAINAVSVYSPAWAIVPERLKDRDLSDIRLTLQKEDVWAADFLWTSLKQIPNLRNELWIIAGDFNLSETFDSWSGGPRGNLEYLDRMADLGLIECLRKFNGQLIPTFRNPRDGAVKHQIDHIFVSPILANKLTGCHTGLPEDIFNARLSDHLPIIVDFDFE
jgi:exonuclease III